MYRYPQVQLLVFAKAPVPGEVKTRLIPALSAQQAADLHRELVAGTLQRLTARELCAVSLYCAPDTEHPFFRQLAREYPLELCAQAAGDLGTRMARAVHETLAMGKWPILVGTDCPILDGDVVVSACEQLRQGLHAVLAPAEDGGYALLGLRQQAGALFEGKDWGSDRVLEQTRQALRELGWNWTELDSLWDLDRPGDLHRYRLLGAAGQ